MNARIVRAGAITLLFVAAACGGGGGRSTTPTTSGAPGASIDPNANGTFTGPINTARRTADQVNQQQQQPGVDQPPPG